MDESIAFVVREKVVDNEDVGFFVDQLKTRIFGVDPLEEWVCKVFVQGKIGV